MPGGGPIEEGRRPLLARAAAWLRGGRAEATRDRARRAWTCFTGLYAYEPRLLSWAREVPGAERLYLLLTFSDAFLRRYSGHEVVLFNDTEFLYYWLPGAKPNATGYVKPGRYALLLHTRTEGRRLRLELEKSEDGAFTAHELELTSETSLPGHTSLQPRSLDYGQYFVPELEALVLAWLTGYAQALHLGWVRPSAEESTKLATQVEPCREMEPLVRIRAGELLSRLRHTG
ncbi:hypothetical protein [Hyalangium rubrum]|uniref:Uncharacterized protein n=1 Tax=Hyalangium rubrum TaxID=3103134 RepID=A0ABU5GZ57_9BACT|nr:hypothetical protein [Hyalangium sp. s54d21]MDY7225115.1 hypothetical protein [Hyalangium sp. s54d21]